MRCPKCGTENSDERRFCAECGDPLLTECPQCSFENQASANFCGGCGRPIMTAASAGLDLPAQPPPYLRDRILQARNTMLGERKRVTVLFADIKGSTALIEGMDPEQAAEQLEPVLAAMIDAVHQMEGTVNRIHGDGIMALFGAPIAYEDHAVRACHSALAMVDAVKAVSDDKISIRVGLNSGEVVMRSIANDMSMDYDAVGTTVHI
ncbi:MAG: zinc-ribbon domain-containing protein, partial [Minwuiales bacterium]|nr:zinc-ribbon domain-containing protein [Minwuiales bacterium]